MPTNRWIGQAVARQEVRYYIPENVTAGDRFQLADGVNKYGYTYPAIPPDSDISVEDRARRVVEQLVEEANSASATGLGGGATNDLSFLVSNYSGKPAVRVEGPANGAPIGIVPTVTPSSGNQITIQQLQEGTAGRDFIFTLTWPTVPTGGKWAIAANGKRPIILDYNATTTQLRDALLTFGIPCTSITVTGSHTAGYTVTLATPTGPIEDPPVMFPVVPVPGQNAILSYMFTEDETYRFGPEVAGYALDSVFDADITPAALKTYLSAANRMGVLANDVTITRALKAASTGYIAGAKYTFEFATEDSYIAFQAMIKVKLTYDWKAAPNTTPEVSGFRRYLTATGQNMTTVTPLWRKVRQKPATLTHGITGAILNPFERSYHTKTWVPTAINNAIVISGAMAGYTTELVNALAQTISHTVVSGSVIETDVVVDTQFMDGVASNWNLTGAQVTVDVGVGTAWTPITMTMDQDPAGTELGVNNNAGYTVETVGTPGIINQEVRIPQLDGNFNTLYQFEWDGRRSHMFTGASGLALIRDAAEALWGAGNVSVSADSGDYVCRIQFVSRHAEREIVPLLVRTGTGGATEDIAIAVTASTPMKAWVLRYQFTGGVCSGSWRFVDSTGAVFSTRSFKWISHEEITAADIRAAIMTISSEYQEVLKEADIEVETEMVGRQWVLREFAITWQAQPAAAFATVDLPFWLGIDTANLKTAEPSYATTQIGIAAQPEIQVVALNNKPTSGTFTLTLNASTTAAIAFNASAAAVQSALSSAGISTTVVGGSGGPYRIRWTTNAATALLTATSSLGKTNSPTLSTVVLAGTGPNHYDNPDNWSLGVIPANGDTIVFADGSVDCSYGLGSSTVTPASIDVYRTFTGRIGLPEIRDDGSQETIPNWLAFSASSGSALLVRIGLGDSGEGPSICRIDVSNRPVDCTVLYSTTGLTQKVVGLRYSHTSSKVVVIKGDVGAGIRPEDICNLASLQIVPSQSAGDEVSFSSSASSSIVATNMLGGTANLGSPPQSLVMIGGTATVNGTGVCRSMDISGGAVVRWLAGGSLGLSGTPSAVQFGPAWGNSSATAVAIRFVQTAHGLSSGQRVYVRAYSGVFGIDGKSFAVQVIDANTFELLGSSGLGTAVGYSGLISWAIERAVIVRGDSVLDFDSDGRSRDIVAPIVVQGTGTVSDSKVTISDLRLWPEQVEGLLYMGQSIELRRSAK